MGKYQTYSDEFKKEAVRLLESTNKPKTTIEKELGIMHGMDASRANANKRMQS